MVTPGESCDSPFRLTCDEGDAASLHEERCDSRAHSLQVGGSCGRFRSEASELRKPARQFSHEKPRERTSSLVHRPSLPLHSAYHANVFDARALGPFAARRQLLGPLQEELRAVHDPPFQYDFKPLHDPRSRSS